MTQNKEENNTDSSLMSTHARFSGHILIQQEVDSIREYKRYINMVSKYIINSIYKNKHISTTECKYIDELNSRLYKIDAMPPIYKDDEEDIKRAHLQYEYVLEHVYKENTLAVEKFKKTRNCLSIAEHMAVIDLLFPQMSDWADRELVEIKDGHILSDIRKAYQYKLDKANWEMEYEGERR